MSLASVSVRAGINGLAALSPKLAERPALAIFRRTLGRGVVRDTELGIHRAAVRSTFSVGGSRVVLYRWGTGERPVLVLHGWQSRASRFSGMVEALLAEGYSVVSFDAPGHGESDGTGATILDYLAAARYLQELYGTFHSIVAHSFGVLSAFYAISRGVRSTSLVALSGVSELGFLVDEFSRKVGLTRAADRALRSTIADRLFADIDDPWTSFDVTRLVEQVALPILVIHDEEDRTVPVNHADRIQDAYGPTVRTVRTTGLGHSIMSNDRVLRDSVVFVLEHDREDNQIHTNR